MTPAKDEADLVPIWRRNQRNSAHGVDFPYQAEDRDLGGYFKRYAETLLAVDESVGAIVDWLKQRGQLESTVLIFMSDNGFAFGEHGLIDKRTAYEESMRIPLLMHCPELFPGGRVVPQLVANLDIASTILDLAGLRPPPHLRGHSLRALAAGGAVPVRTQLLYEYAWERNYPQTPTLHALRREDFKYIHYHGVWDLDELFDLRADPAELRNLILEPAHAALITQLNEALFRELEATGGMSLALRPDRGVRHNLRRADGSPPAGFPAALFAKK